jgi:Zn-dependent M28 family amino/carboxypeptidase
MSRTKAIAISFVVCLLAAFCAAAPAPAPAAGYHKAGESALEWTRQFVALGPRPSDSPAHRRQQALIINELKRLNATMVEEKFTAQTPNGPLAMNNIIAKFPGTSDRIVVLSGHYDTYNRPGLHFVGANDGGSSAGLLLALAAELKGEPRRNAVWLLFLDGEESIRAWQDNDNTYGSRHQVGKWTEDGTIPKITALINVDMIGDADLELLYEGYSTPWLRDLVWETGNDLGYPTVFAQTTPSYIEDDHRPFLDAGVPAVDLIDFHYGPSNRYWHTEEDTVDKLSARSFGVMAHVVLETVQNLEQR